MSHQNHQPIAPSSIAIDPALSGLQYPPYYPNYPHDQQQQRQHDHLMPHHLSGPMSYSSPSSQASETIGTPPTDVVYPPNSSSNANGKRPSGSSNLANDSRKKQRRSNESDTQDSPTAEKEEPKPKPTRGSRACTVCRRLKMKCVGAEHGPPCKRCTTGNHECIFEESNRGKRSSKKHELLSRSLRKMEKTLDTVLRSIGNPSITSGIVSNSPSPTPQGSSTQALISSPSPPPSPRHPAKHLQQPGSPKLHSLPDNSLNPLGLLAEASLANRRSQVNLNGSASNDGTEAPKLGVASDNYFKPGPMTILPLRRLYIERQIQPEMLGFVTTDEVVALFNIYFDHIHACRFAHPIVYCLVNTCLDALQPFGPQFPHTIPRVLPLTVPINNNKFYTAKPELHPRLTELAKKLAFSVPAKGYKSVEIVQAYLLLSLWGCGAVERYEQDKTWMLLGMAIRMATDLNLHRKAAATVATADGVDGKARDVEVHNRERTWILCFCLDRSFSAQMGKPNSIREDYIIRHATTWYKSPVANPSDVSLVAYVELQRILARSLDFLYSGMDTASGLQNQCDYLLVIKTFEMQLNTWLQTWVHERNWEGETPKAAEYKTMISRFYFNYAMLVLNSFGLQNALERAPMNIGHFFVRCHTSATACAITVRDDLGPSGYIKYSPDSHFVQISYAVLSLLKLIRPEFQAFLDTEQATLQLVKDVADVLDNIAANPLHTPALYSGFLRALIAAKLEPPTAAEAEDEKGADSESDHDTQSMAEMPPPSGFANHHQNLHNSQSNPHSSHLHNATTSPSSNTTSRHHQNQQAYVFSDQANSFSLNEFQFDSEMGPVADISTFPPTMAPIPSEDVMGAVTMENILSSGFWDSMLVPGYNSLDGFSGGFVFGAGGSGLITPRFGVSPMQSGHNSPARYSAAQHIQLTQNSINAAFNKDGIKVDPS